MKEAPGWGGHRAEGKPGKEGGEAAEALVVWTLPSYYLLWLPSCVLIWEDRAVPASWAEVYGLQACQKIPGSSLNQPITHMDVYAFISCGSVSSAARLWSSMLSWVVSSG